MNPKKEQIHGFLKILKRLLKERTWKEQKSLEKNVKIRNAFLLSGTHVKPGICKAYKGPGGHGILDFGGSSFKAFYEIFF